MSAAGAGYFLLLLRINNDQSKVSLHKISYCIHIYPPSSQYLANAPLPAFPALSLCGEISMMLAHLEATVLLHFFFFLFFVKLLKL